MPSLCFVAHTQVPVLFMEPGPGDPAVPPSSPTTLQRWPSEQEAEMCTSLVSSRVPAIMSLITMRVVFNDVAQKVTVAGLSFSEQ